ncbi:hypothetical protein KZX46_03650 (plasmid) [Polymorphobacter sp. PAMC 29334]|uniref:hypothetical protein n=1 Tax=Polymorphobacter sp. PAMC 29334 TaxID=2862331 RepID=UPI001C7843E3|nr:hypothetical protein [Polymorphobacter sp. PAMC 29334]QYE33213.1 hypothetical protein KZX46_03650 [Polymorphobacter sp. PAMC 29334]
MKKAVDPKLKVFSAQMGFYDSVVAARSQTAALEAWGTRQNLFASGQARQTDDAQAVEAARAQPGVPLRRLIGTTNPFELKPRGLPEIPDAPRKWAEDVHPQKPPAKPPRKKKPADRRPLDKAEAALRQVDEDRKREEAELRRRQDELDAEREASQARYVEQRKQATGAVVEARTAYRKAGGTD